MGPKGVEGPNGASGQAVSTNTELGFTMKNKVTLLNVVGTNRTSWCAWITWTPGTQRKYIVVVFFLLSSHQPHCAVLIVMMLFREDLVLLELVEALERRVTRYIYHYLAIISITRFVLFR